MFILSIVCGCTSERGEGAGDASLQQMVIDGAAEASDHARMDVELYLARAERQVTVLAVDVLLVEQLLKHGLVLLHAEDKHLLLLAWRSRLILVE